MVCRTGPVHQIDCFGHKVILGRMDVGICDPVLYFGVTFDNKVDSARVLPDHDEFVQKMQKLAASRDLLHPYLFVIPAFSCLLYPSCCLNCS